MSFTLLNELWRFVNANLQFSLFLIVYFMVLASYTLQASITKYSFVSAAVTAFQ
jgi:hypothetical protein